MSEVLHHDGPAAHAFKRFGRLTLIGAICLVIGVAWATNGFRTFPTWDDFRRFNAGETSDLPKISEY